MTSYLKHERKFLEQKIREYYTWNKKFLSVEELSTPLRALTYEGNYQKPAGSVYSEFLASMVDDYVHKYHVRLKKDITLEKALRKII